MVKTFEKIKKSSLAGERVEIPIKIQIKDMKSSKSKSKLISFEKSIKTQEKLLQINSKNNTNTALT
jgi:hypothetical protein